MIDLIIADGENNLGGWLVALGLNGILAYAAPLTYILVPYLAANGFIAYASIAFLLGQPSYDWADEIPYIFISVAAVIASIGVFVTVPTSSRGQRRG